MVEWPEEAVYLIDTTVGLAQIEAKYDIIQPYEKWWRKTFSEGMIRFADSKVTIMTYPKFGALCHYYPEFLRRLKLIICDEFHNSFWSAHKGKEEYRMDKNEQHMYSTYAIRSIKTAASDKTKMVIALTATPQKVLDNCRNLVYEILPNKPVQQYEENHVCYYRNLEHTLSELPVGTKALIYIPHVSKMIECREMLRNCGHRCEAIWSLQHKEQMSEEQIRVRQSIIKTERIP